MGGGIDEDRAGMGGLDGVSEGKLDDDDDEEEGEDEPAVENPVEGIATRGRRISPIGRSVWLRCQYNGLG